MLRNIWICRRQHWVPPPADDYQVYREEAAVILDAADNTPIGEFTLDEMK